MSAGQKGHKGSNTNLLCPGWSAGTPTQKITERKMEKLTKKSQKIKKPKIVQNKPKQPENWQVKRKKKKSVRPWTLRI